MGDRVTEAVTYFQQKKSSRRIGKYVKEDIHGEAE